MKPSFARKMSLVKSADEWVLSTRPIVLPTLALDREARTVTRKLDLDQTSKEHTRTLKTVKDTNMVKATFLLQILGNSSGKHRTQQQQRKISYFTFHIIFHCFQPFHCCLSVVLWPEEGDFPKNLHRVVCVIINKRSFESFYVFGPSSFYFLCAQ